MRFCAVMPLYISPDIRTFSFTDDKRGFCLENISGHAIEKTQTDEFIKTPLAFTNYLRADLWIADDNRQDDT